MFMHLSGKKRGLRAAPSVEPLEDRSVPSVTPLLSPGGLLDSPPAVSGMSECADDQNAKDNHCESDLFAHS